MRTSQCPQWSVQFHSSYLAGLQVAGTLGVALAAQLLGLEELCDSLDRALITHPDAQHAADRASLVWSILDSYFQHIHKRKSLAMQPWLLRSRCCKCVGHAQLQR